MSSGRPAASKGARKHARKRVRLVHWNAAESKERVAWLEREGLIVECDIPTTPDVLRRMAEHPPDAVVVDLTRVPSAGRDVGLAVRQRKGTRHVPLIFVEGDTEKVEKIRKLLPDAAYTDWKKISGALKTAIVRPPASPVLPRSSMAGYEGAPLAKKLGIREKSVIALAGAPANVGEILGPLPQGARLQKKAVGACDLLLWFTRSRADMTRRIDTVLKRAGDARLWIIWPKQTASTAGDLTQAEVRRQGLAAGWVDFKICSIDETWSGLQFVRRRAGRS